jgi:hypothetical protein
MKASLPQAAQRASLWLLIGICIGVVLTTIVITGWP